jgi:hypothetical protein
MDLALQLNGFYSKARSDHRIGATHISLYFALLYSAYGRSGDYFHLDKISIMKRSKVCSRVTYHRCLRALHEYGYVEYLPSFIAYESKVKVIELT